MISFETAKALKEAGLQWKPQIGDWFYTNHRRYVHMVIDLSELQVQEDYVFDPRLDQMLKDIEGQGFRYILEPTGKKDEVQYCLTLLEWDDNVAEISFGNGWHLSANFCATSPEEATAQALLWILRREVCSCENL